MISNVTDTRGPRQLRVAAVLQRLRLGRLPRQTGRPARRAFLSYRPIGGASPIA